MTAMKVLSSYVGQNAPPNEACLKSESESESTCYLKYFGGKKMIRINPPFSVP